MTASLPLRCGGVPLYNGNDMLVIPLHVVFHAFLEADTHRALSFPRKTAKFDGQNFFAENTRLGVSPSTETV
jgi:hypothetical protein